MRQIIIVSGRSGAGKTTAARALEDLGYFVVDNLPPQLLDELMSIAQNSQEKIEKLAVIVDVRETTFLELLPKKWRDIDGKQYIKSLLYLDASEKHLIDRYQETKRRHPLDDGCGIRQALKLENDLLQPVREIASKEILTDKLTSHELRQLINREVAPEGLHELAVNILSFGFKHGVPAELDLCFDVRFLKNPYYFPELKSKSGLDKEVYDFVLGLPQAQEFLNKLFDLLIFLHPQYVLEGKSNLTIAIGCTGGQHRSVALAEAIAERLASKINKIRVEHRDFQILKA